PEQAMYRELYEEVGLHPEHVRTLGRTKNWLRYDVPTHFVRRESRGRYRGQKQICFLLRMIGQASDVSLRATPTPESDAWRWGDYCVAVGGVIHFKREVYFQALNELSVHLFKHRAETRYVRQRRHLPARQRTDGRQRAPRCPYRLHTRS